MMTRMIIKIITRVKMTKKTIVVIMMVTVILRW